MVNLDQLTSIPRRNLDIQPINSLQAARQLRPKGSRCEAPFDIAQPSAAGDQGAGEASELVGATHTVWGPIRTMAGKDVAKGGS